MKAFFEGIQFLFEEIFFLPMNLFREWELTNWWGANLINWIFLYAFVVIGLGIG